MADARTEMAPELALAIRMRSLLLDPAVPRPDSVRGVVEWFGAMQAQEVGSGLWSLGARLPGQRLPDITDALQRGEAVRTWPMRGTIHFVPPADARWMLDLMGTRVLPALARVREREGIGAAEADRAVDVLRTALAGTRLTRAETMAALTEAGLDTTGQRGYHLLVYAAINGVICFAPHAGTQQEFCLLDSIAPDQHRPGDGAAVMAERYFRAHGPATEKDFARPWTGLTLTEARRGMRAADLRAVSVDGTTMYLHAGTDPEAAADTIVVLPGFDEYVLGYKQRALMAEPRRMAAIVPGGNGVFLPTVVRAGRVIATWKRVSGARKTVVTVTPFERVPRTRIAAAFETYRAYLATPLDMKWADG